MRNIIGIILSVFVVIAITAAFRYRPRGNKVVPANLDQFPYFAYLDVSLYAYAKTSCGASLINDEWLLTSAHCVDETILMKVHLGDIVQELYSEHVHVHPAFDFRTSNNDIALLQLPQKVDLSKSIQPVSLPKNCEQSESVEVVAIGRGPTRNQSHESDQLKNVFLNTIPLSDCVKAFPIIGDRKTFVCAKGSTAGEESICNGDIGGPLVTVADKTLIATASFTVPTGCGTSSPMAYTYVYSHLAWIKNVTGLDLPSCE